MDRRLVITSFACGGQRWEQPFTGGDRWRHCNFRSIISLLWGPSSRERLPHKNVGAYHSMGAWEQARRNNGTCSSFWWRWELGEVRSCVCKSHARDPVEVLTERRKTHVGNQNYPNFAFFAKSLADRKKEGQLIWILRVDMKCYSCRVEYLHIVFQWWWPVLCETMNFHSHALLNFFSVDHALYYTEIKKIMHVQILLMTVHVFWQIWEIRFTF